MFTINKSDLILVRWILIKGEYEFIGDPEQSQTETGYPIKMDYLIRNVENEHVFVRVKADINRENKLPGYILSAEGGAIINIQRAKENQTLENLQNLAIYSGLNIAINHLRNSLEMMTFQSPIGPYILPAIDLKDLIDQKQNSIRNDQGDEN